jgi:Bacterial Ig domain
MPLRIGALGVLGNDSDREGDALTAVLEAGPAHGSLELYPHGSLWYTPDGDYNGSDTFTYRANDGGLNSDPATVTIELSAVEDAPRASGDAFATEQDTPLSAAAPGVLANDADPEGGSLTAALISGPGHGTLELNPDGSFLYTPDSGYNGSDSFSYRASDGGLDSDPVTATIEVRADAQAAPGATPGGDSAAAPPAGAAPAAGPAAPTGPAIAQLRLGSRCVRPSRSGRVRIPMTLRMARPGPVQVRIDRAVGTKNTDACVRPNPGRRFRRVALLRRLSTQPAAAGRRRVTLSRRLAPGLYRITVRAHLENDQLSRPARRYLRVLG